MLFRSLNRFPWFTHKQSSQGYFFSGATVNSTLSLVQSLNLTHLPLQAKLHLSLHCKQNENASFWPSGAQNWIKSSSFFQLYRYTVSCVRTDREDSLNPCWLHAGRAAEATHPAMLCRAIQVLLDAIRQVTLSQSRHKPGRGDGQWLWQPRDREAGAAAGPARCGSRSSAR